MTLDNIEFWHQVARPNPTDANFNVQLGCHLEEIGEMFETLTFHAHGLPSIPGEMTMLYEELKLLADYLKSGETAATINNRKEMLDSLADQIVTSVGVGHCAQMNVPVACNRVDESNWSKYDELGKPIFNEHGKITKGPDYFKPDLTGLY